MTIRSLASQFSGTLLGTGCSDPSGPASPPKTHTSSPTTSRWASSSIGSTPPSSETSGSAPDGALSSVSSVQVATGIRHRLDSARSVPTPRRAPQPRHPDRLGCRMLRRALGADPARRPRTTSRSAPRQMPGRRHVGSCCRSEPLPPRPLERRGTESCHEDLRRCRGMTRWPPGTARADPGSVPDQ